MNSIPYASARGNLAEIIEDVCVDHIPVIITRDKSHPAVVLISLEDYQGMQETNYLMHSTSNAARLADAINEVESRINNQK